MPSLKDIEDHAKTLTTFDIDPVTITAVLETLVSWGMIEKHYSTKDGKRSWYKRDIIPQRYKIENLDITYVRYHL